MSAFTTSTQHCTQGLPRVIRQDKDVKGIHVGHEEGKVCLFTEHIILHKQNNLRRARTRAGARTHTHTNHNNKSTQWVAGSIRNIQQSAVFLDTSNEESSLKFRKQCPQKEQILKNILEGAPGGLSQSSVPLLIFAQVVTLKL